MIRKRLSFTGPVRLLFRGRNFITRRNYRKFKDSKRGRFSACRDALGTPYEQWSQNGDLFCCSRFFTFFLQALNKVGGIFNARAVYWREKLNPSLYLIPETSSLKKSRQSLGEERLNWNKWRQELNPVVQLQFDAVKMYFDQLHIRRVRADIKHPNITFLWGNIEIAEIRRKGKRFELATKTKWLKDAELARQWQKSGWVDASGVINPEFCLAITAILDHLEEKERRAELKPKDALSLYLHQGKELSEHSGEMLGYGLGFRRNEARIGFMN